MSGFELFTVGTTAITLGDVGAGLAAVGGAVSAVGAVRQGIASDNQARFQSEVQRQQAERERQQAALDEEDFRRKQSALAASRRAAMGASGVEAGTGSPLLVSEDFEGETELQALRIRSGGELRSTRLEQESGLTRLAGRNARTSGFMRGGALLLEGTGRAFS